MALQFKRGSTSTLAAYTPFAGEPLWATNTNDLYIGDGVTPGGILVADGGGSGYVLPTATTSTLGGVKIDGTTITIDGGGVISATNPFNQTLNTSSNVRFASMTVTNANVTTELIIGTDYTNKLYQNNDEFYITSTYPGGLWIDAGSSEIVLSAANGIRVNNPFTTLGSLAISFQTPEILPLSNAATNLGASSYAWKNLFLISTGTIYFGTATLSVSSNQLYFNGSQVGGNPFNQTLDTTSNVQFNSVILPQTTNVTNSLTAQTGTFTIDSWSTSTFRSAKYVLSIDDGTDMHLVEILGGHIGANTYKTEYAVVTSNGELATFSTDINSGNFRLIATTTATIDIAFARTSIVAV